MSKNKVPPAKTRYDNSHPVISFRASREEYDRLKALLAKEDKSIGEFFREALGSEERGYKEAFNRGYGQGFNKAKERWVAITCVSCCQPIFIDDELAQEMANEMPYTFLHDGCPAPSGTDKENIKRFKLEK